MLKKKKIAAIAVVGVIAASLITVGVNAQSSGSGETKYNNTNFSDTITNVFQDGSIAGTNSALNVYYMYGASQSGKADLISNYVYNISSGYKYATIKYGDLNAAQNNVGVTHTTIKTTTATFPTSAPHDVKYGGYFKELKSDNEEQFSMTYTLALTK